MRSNKLLFIPALSFIIGLTGCELTQTKEEDIHAVQVGVGGRLNSRIQQLCADIPTYPEGVVKSLRMFHKTGKLTVSNYDIIGKTWGGHLSEIAKIEPNINNTAVKQFSCFLIGHNLSSTTSFDYFGIHRDMKNAFQAGFREGYSERNADLVLGINLNDAARIKAHESAIRLMDVYREKIVADVVATSRFNRDWAIIMDETLGTFEEITSEGSPAESTEFISTFPVEYENELNSLIACLNERTPSQYCDLRPAEHNGIPSKFDIYTMLEKGFSHKEVSKKVLRTKMTYSSMKVHIDDKTRMENTYFKYSSKKKRNLSEKMMLSDSDVVNQILRGNGLVEQINKISWLFVGHEMGRKFNHNLIPRHELVEWIKRARSIMESKSGANYYTTSIRLLRDGFIDGYGSGGKTEWQRIRQETGLKI